MIFNFLDEKETPYLNRLDRMIVTIYVLGITTKRQLETITGWSEGQVQGALQRIRQQGKTDKERDEWLRFWQVAPGKPFIYSLGQQGIEYACAIRKEQVGRGKKKKRPNQKGHMGHFLGFNEILCRLVEANKPVENWLSGKEVMSYLFHELIEREYKDGKIQTKRPQYLPFRPDGLIRIKGKEYFLEYDTGSETTVRLTERLERYLDAATNLEGKLLPVVWVTISQNRKGVIERVGQRILDKYKDSFHMPAIPTMYCMIEGEETNFLSGESKVKPFWSESI